jgi:fucose permease
MALSALFTVPGLAMSTWVVRTPAIRDHLHASTAEMGLVLLGLSVGSILGVGSGGALIAWCGGRTVALRGLLAVAASLAVIGLAVVTGHLWVAATGLVVFGAGMGAAEVAVNVEGADVERALERPVLVLLHGCFSLGTLLGAVVGWGLTAVGFSVVAHMALLSLISFTVVLVAIRYIPAGTGRRPKTLGPDVRSNVHQGAGGMTARSGRRASLRLWDPYLIALSIVALSVALAEGAATDWLPLLMVDDYHFGAASGSAIYLLFALCMTVGRMGSSPILRRWSKVAILQACTATGALGLLLITMADNRWLAIAAIALWGVGTSLSFPVALAAAADHASNAAARVAAVSMVGYFALLVGPPLLGLVGEHVGLRRAMLVPLAFLLVALLIARRLTMADRCADDTLAASASRSA